MVVTVNSCRAQLCAYLVELVAELSHLVGAVLVTGNDLVNRVYYYSLVVPVLGTSDQLGSQFIHGDGSASQIPDIDVPEASGRDSRGIVDILEPVQTGRPVELQIDVKHSALHTVPAVPLTAFCDRYTEFYEVK